MNTYNMSFEGVEALRRLAVRMAVFGSEWADAETRLVASAQSLDVSLGTLSEPVNNVAADICRDSRLAAEYLEALRNQICALADAIEEQVIIARRPIGLWERDTTFGSGRKSAGCVGAKCLVDEPQDTSRGQPRELAQTAQEKRARPSGAIEFDHPRETGLKLDMQQGKVPGFHGTCGLVSCVNLLRLAGVEGMTEKTMVDYAANHKLRYADDTAEPDPLCDNYGEGAETANGSTSAKQRERILRHFGLETKCRVLDAEGIARAIEQGKGVIVSVKVSEFYKDEAEQGFHAVVPISTVRDSRGVLLGFEVADSNSASKGNNTTEYYSLRAFSAALTDRPCNVTKKAIW